MGMNPQQQEAVDTIYGAVMVLAGAGSGKTRVIIHRIANLIRHGISPKNILAVTFTNKAAKEMRQRVADLLSPQEAEQVTVSTFHAFCLNVLRRHIHRLGYSKHFSIATEGYQKGLVREIISEHHFNGRGCDPGLWMSYISKAKGALEEPEDLAGKTDVIRAHDVATVYRVYDTSLKNMDLVDFDDLLVLTVKLWREFPDILEEYRQEYQYILIDEYQDTNSVQLKIMVMLAGENPNICVVGDDDQSIYGWRGANLENILGFQSTFPGAKIIRLEQNYRSTNTILKAANGVIAHNMNRHQKSLWSANGEGEKVKAVLCENEADEASFVGDFIRDQVRQGNWNDFAILFRAGHQARVFEETFRRQRIPYQLVGANSFFKRKEILDAMAFLKLLANPKDDMALLQIINVPHRGIGEVAIGNLRKLRDETHTRIYDLLSSKPFLNALNQDARANVQDFVAAVDEVRAKIPESGPVYPIAEEILNRLHYMEGLAAMYKPREDALKRRDNVMEFLSAIAEYDETKHQHGSLQEYLEQFDLQDAQDRMKDKSNKKEGPMVTLMTVHASKGLEFPKVFVVGMEQGLFPHKTALEEGNLEEERRLAYVAMTRAKEELILTHASRRRVMNQVVARRPSKFLDEVPEDLVVFTNPREAIRPATVEESKSFLEQMRKMLEN